MDGAHAKTKYKYKIIANNIDLSKVFFLYYLVS